MSKANESKAIPFMQETKEEIFSSIHGLTNMFLEINGKLNGLVGDINQQIKMHNCEHYGWMFSSINTVLGTVEYKCRYCGIKKYVTSKELPRSVRRALRKLWELER